MNSPLGPLTPGRINGRIKGPSALGTSVLGLLGVVALVAGLVLAPGQDVSRPTDMKLGEREQVRLTSPEGETVTAIARVDTGASASSIDRELAEDLGLDLENAPTVTVKSSLGEEERPVVGVGLQLAGESRSMKVSVSDRSGLGEKVLLGREDLGGASVVVGQRLLTQPGEAVAPSAADALLLQTAALAPTTMVALLPFCALVIVLLRVVVGLSTLGTFGPVLLAIGFVQSGFLVGFILTLGLLVLGLVTQALLGRAMLPRVARLGILVGLVACVLAALQGLSSTAGSLATWGAALPVVVTATVVERLWETWDADGWRATLVDAVLTLGVAVMVALLMLSPPLRYLADSAAIPFAVACLLWTWVVGSYRGLRVTELVRFSPAIRRPQGVTA